MEHQKKVIVSSDDSVFILVSLLLLLRKNSGTWFTSRAGETRFSFQRFLRIECHFLADMKTETFVKAKVTHGTTTKTNDDKNYTHGETFPTARENSAEYATHSSMTNKGKYQAGGYMHTSKLTRKATRGS